MNSRRILLVAIVAGLLAVGAALALGAAWPRKVSIAARPAPADAAVKIAEGRHYFAMSCAHCHADDATGDEGPNLHKLKISDTHIVLVVKNGGRAETYREADGQRVMQQAELMVRVLLNRGAAAATVWTCDLSHDYVTINAEYRT